MAKKTVTPKQIKALVILATGGSNEKAAVAASVTPATIRNWTRDETFSEELRLTMERTRHQFESRVMQVANNAMVVVQDAMSSPSAEVRLKGANLALNAAVRLSTRYKELQVEGYVPPPTPMIVFPAGTKQPWANTKMLAAPEMPEGGIVDVEAIEVAKE